MTEDRNLVDDVLDRALAAHGRCEPRPGLEGRILAGLRSVPPPRPWWQSLLGSRMAPVALGAVALVLAGVGITSLVLTRAGSPAVTSSPIATSPSPTAPPAVVTDPRPSVPVREERLVAGEHVRSARPVSLSRAPRRHSFPQSSPLSEQERLLLRYVSVAPREEVETRAGFLDAPAPLPSLPDPTTTP